MTSLKHFLRDTSGTATVEFVLWLPVLATLLLLGADATLAFMKQSQMWQVSRETARIVSRYGMDELTAEAFARQSAAIGTTQPNVDVSIEPARVVVSMTMPTDVMTPFGTLDFFLPAQVSSRVTHAMEPL